MRFDAWFQKSGLTQAAIARRLGVTQGRVAQLLGGSTPSLALASRIMVVTNGAVTPNDFVTWSQPQEVPQ